MEIWKSFCHFSFSIITVLFIFIFMVLSWSVSLLSESQRPFLTPQPGECVSLRESEELVINSQLAQYANSIWPSVAIITVSLTEQS